MIEEWRNLEWTDCPECGGDLSVFTSARDGYCFDGDKVRCSDCNLDSCMSVDSDDGTAWVQEI